MVCEEDPIFVKRYRERMIQWRREPTVHRIDKPTRIERARALGYRENKMSIVVRVRIRKGNPFHTRPRSGRRPKRMGVKKLTYAISDKKIAEQRAQRKFTNMKVMGSYLVGEDGQYKWYEVILVREKQ
ncbi:hypothetical protein B9Q11_03360 [Candidatus Marsarchaeota G2 archaeon ECH_B_SAG-F08]|uniref:50S ribosomal protein L15e n=4 Tax=Candidatus Marsarchaeota TaxID=1978152 RepID=A0A2R6AKE3_9ARCH|nr:MAG: hypothetical protein B9Q02_00760 [Candidatus Marsarchaeota G1 archaeon BE_D]PSN89732.1 MAG: hypothetical protein B9Q00_00420 [Candidatus Marsarchaeota G1 archaeon OSP_C]PSN97903.1 MAG: hypothetical protein B9Q11_03360 [Candidatus Marsarchaeota G2 archaeon ECH_B_SAG-F08]PSO02936.1 MAG: hypothetical protein B9Q10_00860 [Candidatus Marsarchaeota G2 archaeon ECH_B_SAG-E12]